MIAPAVLHRRISADLEGAILSGSLAPGDRIPFEHELTLRYGCSRMTVNKALSALAARGLIIRRRRAGTFVAWPRARAAVLAIPDLKAETTDRGQIYDYRLLSRHVRGAQTDEELDLAGEGLLLALESLHLSDGVPLALEYRMIALAVAPEAARADFTVTPPGTWLLDFERWTDAEHRISALAAPARTARLLAVETGAACLCVERRTWRDGRGVTRVWQTFRGDRYDLIARFTPGAHSQDGYR
ncbi:histidine utilization repressor [soil metagenome]